jgi:hypothetical protein
MAPLDHAVDIEKRGLLCGFGCWDISTEADYRERREGSCLEGERG